MKFIRNALALVAIITSTQTLAGTPLDYDVPTMGDLVVLCNVSEDDSAHEAAKGFCLGYIDAAMDYHAALTAGPKYNAIICPDGTVSREEVVGVVMEWSASNADLVKNEAPVHGVMRALVEKWPC
jgi:hypothetical protein